MFHSILQHSVRYFSTGPAIPGFKIIPNFLSLESELPSLQSKALQFYLSIMNCKEMTETLSCQTYLSKQHNLKSKECYRIVKLDDDVSENTIKGQYFEKYGEEGHKLTYFIGNENIPSFIKSGLISKVMQIPEVSHLASKDSPLKWNFTFNTYSPSKEYAEQLSGFPFHKDIESNGIVSVIYSLGAESIFDMRLPDDPTQIYSFPLRPNSLVLLSNEARYDYEHRVGRVSYNESQSLYESPLEKIKRISLVLGFL